MRHLLTFICIFPVFMLSAQLDVIFKNVKPIDNERYKDIKGSSLLFDDWTNATLYDVKGISYPDILVNYNGETNFMEAKKDEEEYIDVNIRDIPMIVVDDVASTGLKDLTFLDSLVLINGPNLRSKSTYHMLLHKDAEKMLLMEFHVALDEVTDQLPGGTLVRKRFNKKYKLILLKGATVNKFFINQKKEVNKQFSEYGDYSRWCKSKKKKPTDYESAVTFLKESQ